MLLSHQAMELAATENRAAFEDFYEKAFPRIYGFVAPRVADVVAAQSVTSEVIQRLLHSAAQCDTGAAAEAVEVWILRTVKIVIAEHKRSDAPKGSAPARVHGGVRAAR